MNGQQRLLKTNVMGWWVLRVIQLKVSWQWRQKDVPDEFSCKSKTPTDSTFWTQLPFRFKIKCLTKMQMKIVLRGMESDNQKIKQCALARSPNARTLRKSWILVKEGSLRVVSFVALESHRQPPEMKHWSPSILNPVAQRHIDWTGRVPFEEFICRGER